MAEGAERFRGLWEDEMFARQLDAWIGGSRAARSSTVKPRARSPKTLPVKHLVNPPRRTQRLPPRRTQEAADAAP